MMYTQLDDRYLLLEERSVRWLEKVWDGWDRLLDRPVTVGYLAPADLPPVLPQALQLRHPNVLPMLDLRSGGDRSVWVVWDYFGPSGAEAFDELSAPSPAVAWVAHETANALIYARGAQSRPGGYRISDFGADQIRLFEDGRVKIVGFGRLATDSPDAHEFGSLGEWTGLWLAHSSDAGDDPESTGSVSSALVSAVSAFEAADANPDTAAPRIMSALRPTADSGVGLAAWMQSIGAVAAEDVLRNKMNRALGDHADEIEEIRTAPMVLEGDEAPTSVLPPVTIAPPEPPKIAPKRPSPHKGIPKDRRSPMTAILVALVILLVAVGGWRFRDVIPFLGSTHQPQVIISTSPPGATIWLDDSLLSETTPVSLNDLPMGIHRVSFAVAEFPAVQDSILVYKSGSHRPFHFVFTRPIRIESRPAGAAVYENGKRAPGNTPLLEREWPVTTPLSLVMHLESYGSIENCVLDPVFGTVEVEDPAMWHADRHGDTLVVQGLFVHSTAFLVSPPDCRLIVDDTLEVDGTGGMTYPLTFGTHKLRGEALGFDPLDTLVVISGQSPHQLAVALTRPVRIFAVDPQTPEIDLRVLVDRLDGPDRAMFVRRFTPYSIRIPAVAFTATLRKRGYRDTTVYVPPDMTSLTVVMTPAGSSGLPDYEGYRDYVGEPEVVYDGGAADDEAAREDLAGAPWVNLQVTAPGMRSLAGAEIWVRASGETRERLLGRTLDDGSLRAQIPVGNYDLLAYLDAFSGVRKRVKVRPGRNRPVVIDLNR